MTDDKQNQEEIEQTPPAPPEDLAGERGLPAVNSAKGGSGVLQKLAMIGLAILALIGILAVNGVFSNKQVKSATDVDEQNKKKSVGSTLPVLPEVPKRDVRPVAATPVLQPKKPLVLNTSNVPPVRSTAPRTNEKKPLTPQERKMLAGLFVDAGRTSSSQTAQQNRAGQRPDPAEIYERIMASSVQGGGADASALTGGGGNSGGDMSDSLTPTTVNAAVAGFIPDRNLMITQGSFIDATLETAISSDYSGFVSCRVSRDVYSTNGNVLLIERGSKIVGQYQGGVKRGKARVYALWNRIETPNGVIIDINSPGTDSLGRTGHTGWLDNHFWERFGGAILLSVVDDLGNYLTQKAAESSEIQVDSSSDTMADAATIALENSINIGPTLYKNQGEHINIFVARDLDFRTVYGLEEME